MDFFEALILTDINRLIAFTNQCKDEQADNKKKIAVLSEEIKGNAQETDTTEIFLDIVESTTHPGKLTEDVIDKIVVHHRKEENVITTQKVEVYYNVIGKFELPPDYDIPTVRNAEEAKALTAMLGIPA